MKKIFWLAILLMIAVPLPIWAGDETITEDMVHQPGNSIVMPATPDSFHESAQSEIDKKNELAPSGNSETDGAIVDYNEDGTISSALFADGTKVEYSYEREENGEIKECLIDAGKTQMVFTTGEKKDTVNVAISQKQGKPGEKETAPKIIIYYPENTVKLEDVARKPVKFDVREIDKAMARASRMEKAALNAYLGKTAQYYEKVGAELRRNIKELAQPGVKIENTAEKIPAGGALTPEERKAIDEAVARIRAKAGRDGSEEALAEFLSFEDSLRRGILAPEKAAYDKKIESAVRYIDGMIDKLINSRLALYLNIDKDKIDAVISLPELKKKR